LRGDVNIAQRTRFLRLRNRMTMNKMPACRRQGLAISTKKISAFGGNAQALAWLSRAQPRVELAASRYKPILLDKERSRGPSRRASTASSYFCPAQYQLAE